MLLHRAGLALAVLTAGVCGVQCSSLRRAESIPAGAVAGRVLDSEGRPCSARVTLVGQNGAVRIGTEGEFDFETDSGEFALYRILGDVTLHASTADGRVAVKTGVERMSAARMRSVALVLESGATIRLSFDEGVTGLRCRLVQDAHVVQDFSVAAQSVVEVVVPDGRVLIQLYSGFGRTEQVRDERIVQARLADVVTVEFSAMLRLQRHEHLEDAGAGAPDKQ